MGKFGHWIREGRGLHYARSFRALAACRAMPTCRGGGWSQGQSPPGGLPLLQGRAIPPPPAPRGCTWQSPAALSCPVLLWCKLGSLGVLEPRTVGRENDLRAPLFQVTEPASCSWASFEPRVGLCCWRSQYLFQDALVAAQSLDRDGLSPSSISWLEVSSGMFIFQHAFIKVPVWASPVPKPLNPII